MPRGIMRTSIIGAVLTAVMMAVGCGASATNGHIPARSQELTEVWTMYKAHLDARKRPPARAQEFDPYEPANIYGYGAITSGNVIMLWGGTAPSSTTRVLAYEKQVPEAGGSVLLDDGTIKTMSADEFKAAPKAGK